MAVHQSLFIAPCSHVFHYKCIRPLLLMHHPGFSCPLCRTFADLEEDVEVDVDPMDVEPADVDHRDAMDVDVRAAAGRGNGAETDVERDGPAPRQHRTRAPVDVAEEEEGDDDDDNDDDGDEDNQPDVPWPFPDDDVGLPIAPSARSNGRPSSAPGGANAGPGTFGPAELVPGYGEVVNSERLARDIHHFFGRPGAAVHATGDGSQSRSASGGSGGDDEDEGEGVEGGEGGRAIGAKRKR